MVLETVLELPFLLPKIFDNPLFILEGLEGVVLVLSEETPLIELGLELAGVKDSLFLPFPFALPLIVSLKLSFSFSPVSSEGLSTLTVGASKGETGLTVPVEGAVEGLVEVLLFFESSLTVLLVVSVLPLSFSLPLPAETVFILEALTDEGLETTCSFSSLDGIGVVAFSFLLLLPFAEDLLGIDLTGVKPSPDLQVCITEG